MKDSYYAIIWFGLYIYTILILVIFYKDQNLRRELQQVKSMISHYSAKQILESEQIKSRLSIDHWEQKDLLDQIIHSQNIERVIREKE